MTLRRIYLGVFGVSFVVAACGGNVSDRTGTPTEQLQAKSADRCKAACVTVVACGLDGNSCDCAACACPDAGSSCVCPPCECSSSGSGTVADCASECAKSVQKVLDQTPQCAAPMLALLDCLPSATCKKGDSPCRAEEAAFKDCGESDRATTPPSANPGGPGPAGTTGIDGAVTCHGGSGGGAAGGPSQLQPGDALCEVGWNLCSDGRSYGVECKVTSTMGELACDCSVDGVVETSFAGSSCNMSTSDVNQLCGWNLE